MPSPSLSTSTVKKAPTLLTGLFKGVAAFVTDTVYVPVLVNCTFVSVMVGMPWPKFANGRVLPLVSLASHLYPNGGVPVTATLKLTVSPTSTVWLSGCKRKIGFTSTVSTAGRLVTEPIWSVTTTSYELPLSGSCTLGIVNVLLVCPERFTPLRRHWYVIGGWS